MNTVEKLDHWAATHSYIWMDLLRFILGTFIFYKGLVYAADRTVLTEIIGNSQFDFVALGLVHYVIFVHLVGGLLIAIGLMTRMAILFNLPVLMGAVIFINADKGFFSANSELGISIVTLLFLIVFLLYGSGKRSADEYMRTHERN